MKSIGTILIYLILISILPLSVGYYLFYVNNSDFNVVEVNYILDDQFNEYTKDSVLINTRNLLINKKYNELNLYLEKLDKKYETDITKEDVLFLSYSAFGIEDIAYEPFFNSWIEFSPKSYIPYLARGVFYYHMGWKARGSRWAKETRDEQFKKMHDYFKKSKDDLEKSLSINKNAVYAYYTFLRIANVEGNTDEEIKNFLKKALEINPHTLKVRQKYLRSITPRWGGSYKKMEDYIKNAELDLNANPKLQYLYGYIDSEKASIEEISKKYTSAREYYLRSLSLSGEYDYILFQLGKISVRKEDYTVGKEELSKAIEMNKEYSDYFYWRTFAYTNLKEYKKAIDDILYAYNLEPYSEKIKRRKVQIAQILNAEAYELRRKYEHDKALELYNLALQVDLENDSIYNGRARAYILKQDLVSALEDIKIAIEINPNDISHYLLIDYILAKGKNWEEIISYWDKFIELNPKNPRAYVERGGAYYHNRNIQKAVENAKISADLGNLEGKEAYEKFKHLAK